MSIEVRFIAKRWPNHSPSSGYHQLIKLLGTEVQPLDPTSVRHTWIPGRLAVKLAQRSGVRNYGYLAFFHEWAAARDMVRNRQPTVYHVLYGDDSFRYLGRMRFRSSSKIVATFHLPPDKLAGQLEYAGHLAALDALILVGTNQLPYFADLVSPERLHYLPHGVDTSVFRPSEEPGREPSGRSACLFVGVHERDFATLEAVVELVGHEKPDVEFILVTSPEMESRFAQFANVRFLSGIGEAQLIRLYQQADLMIQPLLDCTANNAILEGMACGLPSIVSDVGAVRDYLTPECAVFVEKGNALSMASSLARCLEDEERRMGMRLGARRQAANYDWTVIGDVMRRLYESLFQ